MSYRGWPPRAPRRQAGGRRRSSGAAALGQALACALALTAVAGCASERAHPRGARAAWGTGAAASAGRPGAADGPSAETASPSAPYRDPTSLEVGDIVHAATGRLLGEAELLDYLAHVRVVYVGEVHDSVEDHRVQLALLRGLYERAGGKLALGVEMLKRPYQARADAFVRGELDEASFRRVWAESWGHWELYAGLLRFAREKGVRLLALGAEAQLTEAVKSQGVAGPPPDLAARLPEMDLDDPHHRAYLRAIFAAHGRGAAPFDAFYRVQVLWDETMAETAARFLEREDDARLVVLAGAGHVRFGFGVPRRLFRRLPMPYAIVLPVHVEVAESKRDRGMDASPPAPPLPAADFYWAVRYQ
jgi:uncharacterized iron-regulated protein